MHKAGVAHLGIDPSNVLILPYTRSLKLANFNLAQPNSPVVGERTIKPNDIFSEYAAPEVLDVLLSRHDDFRTTSYAIPEFNSSQHTAQLVNGAAADSWATGVTLLEALTCHRHFSCRSLGTPRPESSPFVRRVTYTDPLGTFSYLQHDVVGETRFLQQRWMNAVLTAEKLGSAVQHPIIEAIRHCSTMPDAAVDFFVKLLHPTPAARMTMAEAACHPYLARAMQWLLTKQAHVSGQSTAAEGATASGSADASATTTTSASSEPGATTACVFCEPGATTASEISDRGATTNSGSLPAVTTPSIAGKTRQQPQSSVDRSLQSHAVDCSEYEDEEQDTHQPDDAKSQCCVESIADNASGCLNPAIKNSSGKRYFTPSSAAPKSLISRSAQPVCWQCDFDQEIIK
ncbi:glycogen synthase kinase 3 [Trebouxia sp. C0009 RCD-2024]